MKNRIENCDLSVRTFNTAKDLGFTTIGQLKRFLDNCTPKLRLGHTYAGRMLREVNEEIKRLQP